jgi:hypothetical protein
MPTAKRKTTTLISASYLVEKWKDKPFKRQYKPSRIGPVNGIKLAVIIPPMQHWLRDHPLLGLWHISQTHLLHPLKLRTSYPPLHPVLPPPLRQYT